MGYGRCQSQEVAAEVDGDPVPGACVCDRVPAGCIDTGRKCAPVKERPWLLASESARRRVEPEYHGVGEEFHRDQPYRGVEG